MTPSSPRRPGRPSGNSAARENILANARELFADNGFDRTSIRAIARAAGVDSALVHHYFGTKHELFAAAIRLPVSPEVVLGAIRNTPVEELGNTLPRVLLGLWDSDSGTALIAALRSLLAGPDVSLLQTFFHDIIGAEVAPRVDNPVGSGRIRVQFAASQLVGIVVTRYLVGLEPMASASAEQIAATIGPTLQRYLTGDLAP